MPRIQVDDDMTQAEHTRVDCFDVPEEISIPDLTDGV